MSDQRQYFYKLSERALDVVEKQMEQLLATSKASCCMLVDRSGYLILKRGQFNLVHPEEMATIGAATFNALQSFVNISESPELTVNFHAKTLDNIHFHQVNEHCILLVIYRFQEVTEETIRRVAKECVDLIAPELNKDSTEVAGWTSMRFIHKKLDELFED